MTRHQTNGHPRRADRIGLFGVFVIVIIVRTMVLLFSSDPFAGDPDAYRAIAETLANTGVYGITAGDALPKPTAFRPPLYPYLLSWLTPSATGQLPAFAVGVLHVLMGAITAATTTWVASRLIERDRMGTVSIVAGMLVAIDPILIQQSTQLMTETLATFLSIITMAWWVGTIGKEDHRGGYGSFLVLGTLLALAYLCRPTFLVWAAMLVIGSCFVGRRIALPTRLMRGVLTGLLVAVALAGWSWRNAKSVGHPIWATSHGGYTLLLANNESFYEYLRTGAWGEAWDAEPFLEAYVHRYDGDPNEASFWNRDWSDFTATADTEPVDSPQDSMSEQEPVSEQQDDRRCYLAARATIDRQPMMFVWSCFVRVGRLWSPLPHHSPHQSPGRGWAKVLVVGLYYTGMYAAAMMTLWRLRRKILQPQWWAILTLAITLSGVHAVYWTNMRMRAPIVPAICLLAAGAIGQRNPMAGATENAEESHVAHD